MWQWDKIFPSYQCDKAKNQNKGQNPLENLKTALKVQGWLLYVLPYDCEIPLPEYPPAPISIKPKLVSPKGILQLSTLLCQINIFI